MKKLLLLLLALTILVSGFAVAEQNNAAAGEMAYETSVLSFEIDPNDGSPRYNAIVEVKNTGDVAINLGYTSFAVTDAENRLVAIEESSAIYALPSVVYPGEVGYYFTAGKELPSDLDMNQQYNLVYDTDYIRIADTEGVNDYEVINVSFPDNDYMNIIGEVVNGSDTGDVDVLCICYDENGKIVTIGGTLEELKTSHNTYFNIINYAAWGKENIASYSVNARTRSYN